MDIFSGAGGLSLGFRQAGFVPKLGVDNDSRAMAAYSANFPHAVSLIGDINRMSGRELLDAAGLSECEIVVGGPPCGPFSLAGTRTNDDGRRGLVAEFGRVIREIRPRYFVMENVPGILSPGTREVVTEFCDEMVDGNYHCSDPWLLDASEFGVPQYRRRVFVVGARRGLPLPRKPQPLAGTPPTASEAISDLEELEESDVGLCQPLGEPSAYASALRDRESVLLSGCGKVKHSTKVVKRFEETTPGTSESVSRFYRLHPDKPARTIRAGTLRTHGSHTAARPIHYAFPRCITVREAARLQSIPDWFHVDSTTWRGYMQVGNAVPPLLAQAVAKVVERSLNGPERLRNGGETKGECQCNQGILRGDAGSGHRGRCSDSRSD